DSLAGGLRRGEVPLDLLQCGKDLGEPGRLVDFPILLWRQADARAVCATALVGATEGRGRGPGGRNQLGYREPGSCDLRLELGDVPTVDQHVIARGNDVLPDQIFGGHFGAEIANLRPHVTMCQLEPGSGEGV